MALLNRRGAGLLAAVAAVCVLGVSPVPSMAVGCLLGISPVPATSADVKAALLYNFASFSQWPEPESSGPLVIGVTGDDAVVRALSVLSPQTVNGRPFQVRRIEESDDPRRVQVLYITGLTDRAVAAMLAQTATAPVLTVGDHERFTRLGGIIRLFEEKGHMRFEVDVARATKARLKISSRVLNLARIVDDAEPVP